MAEHNYTISSPTFLQGKYETAGASAGDVIDIVDSATNVYSNIIPIQPSMQNLTFNAVACKRTVKKESGVIVEDTTEDYTGTLYLKMCLFDKDERYITSLTLKSGEAIAVESYPTARKVGFQIYRSGTYVFYPNRAALEDNSGVYLESSGFEYDSIFWNNDESGNLISADLPAPLKYPVTAPYPNALWRIKNGVLTHNLLPEILPKYMEKPYPNALWRIDGITNEGFPYHLLLPFLNTIQDYPNVYIGGIQIKEIFYGSKPITAIYYGKQKIY